jgi:CHASE2 domain-containing sensor protein
VDHTFPNSELSGIVILAIFGNSSEMISRAFSGWESQYASAASILVFILTTGLLMFLVSTRTVSTIFSACLICSCFLLARSSYASLLTACFLTFFEKLFGQDPGRDCGSTEGNCSEEQLLPLLRYN